MYICHEKEYFVKFYIFIIYSRDELMDKIIEICSQNDFQHITNFEWYITVLSELSRMEGGSKHGKLIGKKHALKNKTSLL